MEVWKYGSMEVWKYGSMEVWKYGSMEVLIPTFQPSNLPILSLL
jgi:hypothetical protein